VPLSVATTCPDCGGSIEFPPGSTAVRCGFCASSHLVTGHGRVLSYYIPERIDPRGAVERALAKLSVKGGTWEASEATLFFVPFHHFTGHDFHWCFEEDAAQSKREERQFHANSDDCRSWVKITINNLNSPSHMTGKRLTMATRYIDRTLPALDAPGLRVNSLGFRPEVLKLSLFQKEAVLKRGQVSPVQAGGDELERRGYAPLQQDGIIARKVISRTRSVIYFPFWIIEAKVRGNEAGVLVVVDGVSGEVTNDAAPAGLLDSLLAGDGNHFETVGMRPLKCPDCDADLPARPQDVVSFCAGCGKAWYIRDTELLQVPYVAIPRKEPASRGEYFPFWVMEARMVSASDSIGDKYDLTRLAPGVRVPREADRQVPLRFFVPAFQIVDLKVLSRLAGSFTHNQPVWQGGELPRGTTPASGCFISPEDVLELAPLILFSLVPKENKRALQFALEARVEVKEADLVLVPFARTTTDYVDELIGQALPVSTLRVENCAGLSKQTV